MAAPFMDKHALVDWAVACLATEGEAITYDAILAKLEPWPEAIKVKLSERSSRGLWNVAGLTKVQAQIKAAEAAIAYIESRNAAYRRRMRQLFEIAVPKAYFDGYDEAIQASLWALNMFVGDVKLTAVINTAEQKKAILSAIKRDWRLLGMDEQRMWEPLYELVTGRELLNE